MRTVILAGGLGTRLGAEKLRDKMHLDELWKAGNAPWKR
jgi:molybdopterin-guanine dinucleotide biosynthesis protein A